MPDELRVERLLKIYKDLCESKQGVSKKDLANKFSVSIRTIERDIQIIEKALSLRIEGKRGDDNEWRYLLPEPYRQREIFIKNDNTILLLLELALAHFKSFAERDLSERLLASITSSYPLNFCHELFYYHDEAPYQKPPRIEDLLLLREAFVKKRMIFLKTNNMKRRTLFRLYKIVHYVDEYYLVGILGSEKDVRIISFHEVTDIRITNREYSIPQDFSIEEYLKQAFAIEPGLPEKVTLNIKKPLSDYIKTRLWHPTQRIEEKEDGSIILQITVPVADELVKWILGYGDYIKVLEPDRLKEIIKGQAKRIYHLYNDINCR
jgi:predicted DNA-binding transcriptional regulator YafY